MVSTPFRMSLVIDRGNGFFNKKLNFNTTNPITAAPTITRNQNARRLRMDLHTPMIGRIANAPAGCGSCGGGGY